MVKNPPANAGDRRDAGSIPGSGRSPGGGNVSHSSVLAWRIPWTEEPVRLQPAGSQRVRHDWSDLAHTHSRPDTGDWSILRVRNVALRDGACRQGGETAVLLCSPRLGQMTRAPWGSTPTVSRFGGWNSVTALPWRTSSRSRLQGEEVKKGGSLAPPGIQSPRIKLPVFAPVCRQERIERKTEWRGSRWGRPSYGKCGSWSPRMAPKEPHLLGPMPLCAAPSRIGPGGPVTHWPKECGGSDIMSSVRLNPKGATCLLSLLGSFLLLSRFLLEYNCFWAYQVLQQEGICLPRQETQETWVWPLGRADPLEKETVTHSSILAWRVPRGVWWAMCPRVAKELNTT